MKNNKICHNCIICCQYECLMLKGLSHEMDVLCRMEKFKRHFLHELWILAAMLLKKIVFLLLCHFLPFFTIFTILSVTLFRQPRPAILALTISLGKSPATCTCWRYYCLFGGKNTEEIDQWQQTNFLKEFQKGFSNEVTKKFLFKNRTNKLMCRWFRFAQLAKGKKSRP
jgi:hypothetical protein